MQPWSVLGTILLAISFTASSHARPWTATDVAAEFLRLPDFHSNSLNELRRDVDEAFDNLHRRRAPPESASAAASAASSPSSSAAAQSTPALKTDPKQWDSRTKTACTQALGLLNGNASSNSGIAVCYNLPFLDNSTGAFQADLRLYRVSPPVQDWAGVVDQDVNISLDYAGASVTSSGGGANVKRDDESLPLDRRAATPVPLTMLQSFNFVGQINADVLENPMNSTQLQTLLSPTVILSATNGQKKQVSTTLSSKEASFVNGVMSSTSSSSTPTILTPKNAPFVLPGVTLGIFPVGLIITSSWAVLGIAVVAWGTIGRYQFREHYRRRMRRGAATVIKTI